MPHCDYFEWERFIFRHCRVPLSHDSRPAQAQTAFKGLLVGFNDPVQSLVAGIMKCVLLGHEVVFVAP